MLVTAHGGAFGTGRNTRKYFEKIKDYNVDVIEVDIWRKGDFLYISHLPKIFPERFCLPLRFVFEFVRDHGFKVNCDVKTGGLVAPVTALAREMGVENRILFTGSVKPWEIKDVTSEVYLNKSFFKMAPVGENVGKIKARIESCASGRIKGINFNYKYLNDDFLKRCAEAELDISVFTVDDEEVQRRLVNYPAVVNMTSNIPDVTLKLLGRSVSKQGKRK